MDLTGSIADATAPLSSEILGSMEGGLTGSSAIDTIAQALFILPNLLLAFVGGLGGDLGSTGSAAFPAV